MQFSTNVRNSVRRSSPLLYSSLSPPTTTTTTTTQLNHVEVTTESQQQIDEEAARVEEEKVYQRNFLILRVVVRTSVALTLVTLSSGFVAFFLHTWRQWELNAREKAESETTENVKFNVPILQGAAGSRGASRAPSYHHRTGRRMSVPAVPLGGLGLIQEVRFGNSIETII